MKGSRASERIHTSLSPLALKKCEPGEPFFGRGDGGEGQDGRASGCRFDKQFDGLTVPVTDATRESFSPSTPALLPQARTRSGSCVLGEKGASKNLRRC